MQGGIVLVMPEATKNHPTPQMSYEQRLDRRRRAAADVAKGMTTHEAVKKYAMSIWTVRRACHEHRVVIPRGERPLKANVGSTLKILARLLMPKPNESFASISRDMTITRQRVTQVYQEALSVGFKMDKWHKPKPNGRTPKGTP